MRWVVGERAVTNQAASTSQMGRFETEVMTSEKNLVALADVSGRWIDRARRSGKVLVLDIDSSVSPTYGEREGTAFNGHFECTCYHPLFVFNAVRLQLHPLAYNLANFLRTLALPGEVERWSLTSLREKVVKIGAKVIAHGRYAIRWPRVAVPRALFGRILDRIARLRPPEVVGC